MHANDPATASAHWTIPLTVTISVGTPTPGAAGVRPAESPVEAIEAVPPTAERWFGRPEPDVFATAFPRFDAASLTADRFQWNTALATALCGSLAYQSPAQAAATATNHWSLQTCESVEVNSTACFVASSADAIVVSFRGTQEVADWLINLNTFFTTVSYGSVHRGFYNAFQSIKPRLEQILNQLGTDSRKIVLTGHSLGGALAIIAAAEWQGRFPIAGVYTFGQPAVGLTNFRSWLQLYYPNNIYRFVNGNDIVPQVPPGYRHVGRLYRFDRRGRVGSESLTRAPVAETDAETPTMTEAEFQALKTQLQAARAAAPAAMNEAARSNVVQERFFPSVADHAMDRYLARVLSQQG